MPLENAQIKPGSGVNLEIFLFFAGFFLATYLLGKLLQKLRIPWIFSSLLLGLLLALHNPFSDITSSTTFDFLSQLGMLLLLFVIGFELDLKEISKSGAFVVRTTLALILAEAFVGSILVHYVFDVPWVVSIIVATSFATVGEAFILPILDEFKLTRTKLGQAILGVGVLDDIVELTAIIAATVLVDKTLHSPNSAVGYNLLILASIFLAAFMLGKARIVSSLFKTKDASASILLVFLVIFLFAGIGAIVDAAPLGALLAGLALQSVIPKSSVKFIDSDIKSVAYGIFAPTFFLSVGISADMNYILGFPLLIVLVTAMTMAT